MLCQNCQKNEVKLKITRLVNGVPEELKVCEECAIKLSPYHAKLAKKREADKQSVEKMLQDLIGQASEEAATGTAGDGSPQCESCGLTYKRFRKTYMLGCPDCYDAFGEHLLEDIRRHHGADRHVPDRSEAQLTRTVDVETRIKALRLELDECIQSEDFDRAVRLRDEIRELESQLSAGEGR